MDKPFSAEDIIASYKWLGTSELGFTELVAFHRSYRPGAEHYETNLRQGLFPKRWLTKRPEAAVMFVKSLYLEYLCCYGINPRTRKKHGSWKRARDNEIELVMNFFLDIDPAGEPSNEQIAELGLFLIKAEAYFEDLGIGLPTRAFTGRGYHLLFAIPPIRVNDCPDIKDRLNQFRQGFQSAFAQELSRLELKIDNTMDLSRLAKIYGSKKPGGQRLSRFYGGERKEDKALREHLLSLRLEERKEAALRPAGALPQGFERLLGHDERVRELWDGTGKKDGDTTNSGYDFSLVRQCLSKGITDINDLIAILALRPKGAVRMSRKGMQYIRLTIANAIKQ